MVGKLLAVDKISQDTSHKMPMWRRHWKARGCGAAAKLRSIEMRTGRSSECRFPRRMAKLALTPVASAPGLPLGSQQRVSNSATFHQGLQPQQSKSIEIRVASTKTAHGLAGTAFSAEFARVLRLLEQRLRVRVSPARPLSDN
jgi:hypothetical protein